MVQIVSPGSYKIMTATSLVSNSQPVGRKARGHRCLRFSRQYAGWHRQYGQPMSHRIEEQLRAQCSLSRAPCRGCQKDDAVSEPFGGPFCPPVTEQITRTLFRSRAHLSLLPSRKGRRSFIAWRRPVSGKRLSWNKVTNCRGTAPS
jgi:hypothetical protein